MTTTVREAFMQAAQAEEAWTAMDYSVQELRGRVAGRRVWVGRRPDGILAAFFEAEGEEPVRLDISRVITCSSARITNELQDALDAVQVQCHDARLNEVFFTFLAEVLGAVDAGQALVVALNSTATEWRSLLSVAAAGIGEDQLRGLFGEMCLLADAVRAVGPAVLSTWVGPERGRHDFLGGQAGVEVKTSSFQNRQAVTIHGLRQLEPVEGTTLTLAVTEVEGNPEGRSANDLVEDLLDLGVDPEVLRAKLASAGFVKGMPGSEQRFSLVAQKFWEITDESPVLRRRSLPENIVNAVSDLSYSLDLSALGPRVTGEFDYTRLMRATP